VDAITREGERAKAAGGGAKANWKALAEQLGRTPVDCNDKWNHMQKSIRTAALKQGPFSPPEVRIVYRPLTASSLTSCLASLTADDFCLQIISAAVLI
jgi:hypothetical protein